MTHDRAARWSGGLMDGTRSLARWKTWVSPKSNPQARLSAWSWDLGRRQQCKQNPNWNWTLDSGSIPYPNRVLFDGHSALQRINGTWWPSHYRIYRLWLMTDCVTMIIDLTWLNIWLLTDQIRYSAHVSQRTCRRHLARISIDRLRSRARLLWVAWTHGCCRLCRSHGETTVGGSTGGIAVPDFTSTGQVHWLRQQDCTGRGLWLWSWLFDRHFRMVREDF